MGALALGAHHGAAGSHVGELPAQRGDPVAGEPPIGLDLGLAGAAGADSAVDPAGPESLQVRPQPPHPGQVVLELGELDLELALGRMRVRGEDVEDDRGAVDHRHPERVLEVALLPRRELVVARHEVRVRAHDLVLQLLELSGPQVAVGVRAIAMLHELANARDARGEQQLTQLGERLLVVIGQRGHQVGTLTGAALWPLPVRLRR